MAKRPKDLLRYLSDALGTLPAPDVDYYEKVIDVTAGYNRTLIGVYSLLAVGTLLLLFLAEVSPWAGAALLASWVIFVIGALHTSMHMMAYHKMLLMVDALKHGQELVDSDVNRERASPEALLRAAVAAKGLHRTKSEYLLFGFLAAGGAIVIEHWSHAWRAAAFLGGLVAAVLVLLTVTRLLEGVLARSEDDEEDYDEEDEENEDEETNDRA